MRVIAISIGGWDHHTNLVAQLAALGAELSGCLKAFHDDLGTDLGRTLTLVMTEFGRRVDENGGDGTDHGHGGVMMAMGGGIAGGRVIVKDGTVAGPRAGESLHRAGPPGHDRLPRRLRGGADRHMGLAGVAMGPIFPGFSASAAKFPGLYT